MRILHILNHIQEIGNGIVNVAVDLACMQASNGHTVSVTSSGGEYEKLLDSYNVRHIAFDQARTPTNLIKAVWRFREIINELQPDIVHAHMMTGVVLAKYLRGTMRYTLVSTVHNEFQRSATLMGVADSVIAVSYAVSHSMQQRGISKNKLYVVSNGTIDSPRTQLLTEYQALSLQHPAIVTVAGMYQRKGIAELIDAFLRIAPFFPSAHLYLVGNGPDKSTFESQALTSDFSQRIHFEGFQPCPQQYLLSADIFVLASHREPFGLVLSEAREAGCAIVASNVDGIPEALDQGKAGLLIPSQNSCALAESLTKLLSNPRHLSYWRQQSRKNLDWLSVHRVCQQTLMVYEESIKGKKYV